MTRANVLGEPLTTPMTTKRSILRAAFAAFALVANRHIRVPRGCPAWQAIRPSRVRRLSRCCRGPASERPECTFVSIDRTEPAISQKRVAWLWERHPKIVNLATTQEELDDPRRISSHSPNRLRVVRNRHLLTVFPQTPYLLYDEPSWWGLRAA
jgi:hypothetical protein